MKKIRNISLLLSIAGLLAFASGADAQVRATATVILTVLPAPGVNFISKTTQAGVKVDAGITFDRSNNVMVQLSSTSNSANSVASFSHDSKTNIITAKELRSASSVEIDYLGS
ncbi:MAG: hypothetical protein ACLP05_03550 [Candidatus Kryptoniota bacterium]